MSTTDTTPETARRDAFVGRLFGAAIAAVDLFSIYLGDRRGYYQAFAEGVTLTSAEPVRLTGAAERYAREWFEQ